MKIQIIFLVGVLIFGLGVFQALSVPSLRQQIEVAGDEFLVLRQKSEKLSEILSEIRTVESNLTALQTALPASDEVPTLIIQLEKIAKQSGVGVQHLGFGEGKTEAAPQSTPATEESGEGAAGEIVAPTAERKKISLTTVVAGSYGALQTFLRNLENTSRVVNVTNFRFSPAHEEGEEAELSITLGLEAFYLAEVEEVLVETPLTLDTTSKDYIELVRKVKALRVYRSEVSE